MSHDSRLDSRLDQDLAEVLSRSPFEADHDEPILVEEEIDEKTARRVIEEKRKLRLLACQEDLRALLAKHRCTLTAYPIFRPDGTVGASFGIGIDHEGDES